MYWPHRRQASSHRYSIALEVVAVPVGAALCRDGARSGPRILAAVRISLGPRCGPIATQGRSYKGSAQSRGLMSPNQGAYAEVQDRRAHQAAQPGMEGGCQCPVRHQAPVGRRQPGRHPDTVPANPPNTIAERGLSSASRRADTGVNTITRIALISPVAIDSAITSELAPSAAPVTGPTI